MLVVRLASTSLEIVLYDVYRELLLSFNHRITDDRYSWCTDIEASGQMICAIVREETTCCIRLPLENTYSQRYAQLNTSRSIVYPRLERVVVSISWPTLSTPFLSMLPFTLR